MLLDEAQLTADVEAHGYFIGESKFKDAGKGLFASRRKAFYAVIPPAPFFFLQPKCLLRPAFQISFKKRNAFTIHWGVVPT